MSTSPVDGDGEQCLADEIKQSADCVDRQQDAEDQQNRPRLLVEVLQVKQSYPKQFLGGGVGGGVPPQSHAQWRDALHHEFHAEVGPVEHEVERHEDEAPEQEFAFHDPHAFEVGFDGLLFVEKEPSGDGEEDDDADFAAALHHELEEDAFRSQGEFQHVVAVVDDEVVHEDHEHRDDA